MSSTVYLLFERLPSGRAYIAYLSGPYFSWAGKDRKRAQRFVGRVAGEEAARELDVEIRRRGFTPGPICLSPATGGEEIEVTKGGPVVAARKGAKS